MLTKVKGKIIENTYDVKVNVKDVGENGEVKFLYLAKPELIKQAEVIDWVDICEFSGQPYYNSGFTFSKTINISEDEQVCVTKEVFRADLYELHLFTDKVVQELDKYKEKSELYFKEELANFNEQMIESNERLLSYCKLHKLDPRDTDAIELFKLVYNHSNYKITDGVILETYLIGTLDTLSTSISTSSTICGVSGISASY